MSKLMFLIDVFHLGIGENIKHQKRYGTVKKILAEFSIYKNYVHSSIHSIIQKEKKEKTSGAG